MALPLVRLLRPSALKIDADTPCVLEMHVPVAVPHRLDPSLPAPPYHPGTVTGDDLVELHAMPVLRRLMAAVVFNMFGPEHVPKLTRLLADFDASAVADKENGLDLAAGYWKDTHGVEHHEPIDAYEEDPLSGETVVLQAFVLSLVCGIRDAKHLVAVNPRALRLDFVDRREGNGTLRDELVVEVREYTEDFRKRYIIKSLALPMSIGGSTAALGQKL